MRVIAVVVKIAAPGLTKIPVSNQVSFLSSRFTARSGPQELIVPKNRRRRERINCDNYDGSKNDRMPVLQPRAQPVTPHYVMCERGLLRQHPTSAEVQFVGVPQIATKRKVEDGAAGETADKLNHSIRRRTTLYDPPFWLCPSGFGKQEVG
jgi:hypothetical protein